MSDKKTFEPTDEPKQEMTKEELFKQDPDRFVDLKTVDIIVRGMSTGNYEILCNADTILKLWMLKGAISEYLDGAVAQQRMAAMKKAGSPIVRPNTKGQMLNGLRGMLKRKQP